MDFTHSLRIAPKKIGTSDAKEEKRDLPPFRGIEVFGLAKNNLLD